MKRQTRNKVQQRGLLISFILSEARRLVGMDLTDKDLMKVLRAAVSWKFREPLKEFKGVAL